jgi:mono/diheme cytochrome c family protein
MKNLLFILMALLIGCNAREDKRLVPPQPTVAQHEERADGEVLFKTNCANCHKPDKDFTGPALVGIYTRWEDKKLLFEYVRNSSKVTLENKYAKDLYEKWGRLRMPDFKLTDNEIKSILDYCHNEDPPPQI